MKRSSGILMHISSLPSPYGIGTFGAEAYKFADFLCLAEQKYWQMLPLSPTGFGDSPYQSVSVYAGNPYFIDPLLLIEDSLITNEEAGDPVCGKHPEKVDYFAVYKQRPGFLRAAFKRGFRRDRDEAEAFKSQNSNWISDYALFMAVKSHFGMRSWQEWEDRSIRVREKDAVERYSKALREETDYHIYIQYLFFKQWNKLKAYLSQKGISVIGDLPIYAALDSADVWANPDLFLLDRDLKPVGVAGVPPDYFSKTGQLWGNPVYDWERMEQDGFKWWMDRINAASKLYDVIRIDHFRGLSDYWVVPFGDRTAENGEWKEGPGKRFIDALKKNFPGLQVIAEDLGFMTPKVCELLQYSGYPGMKILQFAFDPTEPSEYLPHNCPKNSVMYTGTHDNETLAGWKKSASPESLALAKEYLSIPHKEGTVWGLIRGGMRSVPDIFIAQMQDYLMLDNASRMNTPSTTGGNWTWRMKPEAASTGLAERIARLARLYGRSDY
jgi:4-alpha-glucanotransferase